MIHSRRLLLGFWIMATTAGVIAGEVKWSIVMEGGMSVPGYNDVQVPNETGTRFSLKRDFDIDREFFIRLRLTGRFGQKHALSLLYAPLTLNAVGTPAKPIAFEGKSFPAGSAVRALYRFNSYRLTYRYRLAKSSRLQLWLGLTAKIRDAEIKLTAPSVTSVKSNVGFVPLLHLYLDWSWTKRVGLLFEADALAAKQGRAEDIAAALCYNLNSRWAVKLGYRLVEGGADVDEVYNFALINYWYAGLIIRWP